MHFNNLVQQAASVGFGAYQNVSFKAMVSLTQAMAVDRATSTYARYPTLRWLVVGFLAIYLLMVLYNSGDHQSDIYTSPEGLRMTVSSPFSPLFMRIHYWGGVLLVPLVVLQKHLTLRMSNKIKSLQKVHKFLGYIVTALVCFMAFGGYSLRKHSTFAGFEFAMILFVAPWVAFLLIVPTSAYFRWGLVHVVSGDALFKACVAVPFARCLGVVLQRYLPLSDGYYIGIASSALLIGIWAVVDLILLLRHPKLK